MKPITFKAADGTKKTIRKSWLKTMWRTLVRFLATGSLACLAVSAGAQSFSKRGVQEIATVPGQALPVVSTTSVQAQILSDFFVSASSGAIPDVTILHKFGSNTACSTSEEDITSIGGTTPLWTTQESVQVKAGGNVNDTVDGTGARTIVVSGVDGNFAVSSETITLAGASASAATTNKFIRVTRAFVATVGTYGGGNTGDIIIEGATSGQTVIQIDATEGQSQSSLFTIPAGKTGYVLGIQGHSASTKPNTIKFLIRNGVDDTAVPFTSKRIQSVRSELSGFFDEQFRVPLKVTEKSDIWATCQTLSGSGAADIEYDVVFYDN